MPEKAKTAVLAHHGGDQHSHHSHKPFRSNLSGRPLFLGHWFHKKGTNYDITKEEYQRLDKKDKKHYVPIEHENDLEELLHGDLDHQILCPEGAILEEGTQCLRDKNGHRHIRHVSDISAKPLFLGKWFHKKGENFDVTDEEFQQMSGEEKIKYIKIDSVNDYEKLSAEYDDPKEAEDKTALNPVSSPALKNQHKFVSYHSDLSGKMLELGKWYHKNGADFDVLSDEWMGMAPEEQAKFIRIDNPTDVEAVEHEQWVRRQNDMIDAGQHGKLNLLSATFKDALATEKNWVFEQFQKYAHKEEDVYNRAKMNLIKRVPQMLQHSDHTFAGVHLQNDAPPPPLLEDVGLKSTAGYKIKLAAAPKIPQHISSVGSGFDGNIVMIKSKVEKESKEEEQPQQQQQPPAAAQQLESFSTTLPATNQKAKAGNWMMQTLEKVNNAVKPTLPAHAPRGRVVRSNK